MFLYQYSSSVYCNSFADVGQIISKCFLQVLSNKKYGERDKAPSSVTVM